VLPPEATMVSELGVGKGSLREALRILEVNGFVAVKSGAGGGPVVCDPERTAGFARMSSVFLRQAKVRLADLLDARVAFEPFMARQAAERQNGELLSELRRLVELGRAVDVADDHEYGELTARFHDLIATLAGNPVLDLYGRGLYDAFISRIPGVMNPHDRRERVFAEHEQIAEAILAGDGQLAELLMRRHMQEFAGFVRRHHRELLEELVDWN
jgi:GntR family transcriptional regulator, transcriptional repressor for pyruvate dehydrogenase complex